MTFFCENTCTSVAFYECDTFFVARRHMNTKNILLIQNKISIFAAWKTVRNKNYVF